MARGGSKVVNAYSQAEAGALSRLLTQPAFWFAAFLAAVAAGLLLPWRLPLGPNAWDTAVYLDAIHRIDVGQVPSIDFFAPVGPLGYYLAALLDRLAPNAQPMLLVNWALLPVMLPVLAVLVAHIDRHSRWQALALLLPFLLFASLPINLHSLYPLPGLDGYGHYNRHIALLLYLLVTTLLFVRSRTLLTCLVGVLMLTLFLVKVTGAVAGAMLVGYAVLVGRLKLREALVAAAAVLAALGALDLATGIVRAYLANIITLIELNTGTLLPRFVTVASVKFNVIAPCVALIGALALAAWREGRQRAAFSLRGIADSPLGWLVVAFVALAFFETQNTGSLEFIGLWPILLLVLLEWQARSDRMRPLVMVLTLAVALPSLVIYVERSARALLGAASHVALDLPHLGPLGRVSVKSETATRAVGMLEHYATQQASYRDLLARDLPPSAILYSETDYQATWLLEIEQAVAAIGSWEAANKRRLNGVFTLDFVDPINRLLDREPPRYVSIGLTPGRTDPADEPGTLAALAATDAILMPKCPPTPARAAIAAHFATSLQGRTLVALAPCWDMYLK
jgi:hypothetical protein